MRATKGLMVFAAAFIFCVASDASPLLGQGTWRSSLQARDLNGDSIADAYYDTALKITWLDSDESGWVNWYGAQAWVSSLNQGSNTGWRLPITRPTNGSTWTFAPDFAYATNDGSTDWGYLHTTSELGHMFYVTLGNLGICTPQPDDPGSCVIQSGYGMSNTGPFAKLFAYPGYYWSGTSSPFTDSAAFSFGSLGDTGDGLSKEFNSFLFGVAVHDGDVGKPLNVSEPASAAIAFLALSLLAVVRRR